MRLELCDAGSKSHTGWACGCRTIQAPLSILSGKRLSAHTRTRQGSIPSQRDHLPGCQRTAFCLLKAHKSESSDSSGYRHVPIIHAYPHQPAFSLHPPFQGYCHPSARISISTIIFASSISTITARPILTGRLSVSRYSCPNPFSSTLIIRLWEKRVKWRLPAQLHFSVLFFPDTI